MNKYQIVLLMLVMLAVLQFIYYYPRLPDTVASHFDGMGRPNGCMPKDGFFKMFAFMTALIICIFMILPKLITRVPASMINLPNKEYWLAPEKQDETFQKIQDLMTEYACAILLFLLAVFHLTIRANLKEKVILSDAVWYFLVGFIAFTLWWIIKIIKTFNRGVGSGH